MSAAKRYPLSEFKPLTADWLALVWQWRNLPEIRRNMHNDSPISWLQHQAWFNALQEDKQRKVFVFVQDQRPIGVLNFTWHRDGKLEWGCYLGETNVWPGSGLLLEIAALDYAANHTDCPALYAEVLSFNHSVIKMHQLFGYQPLPDKTGTLRDGQHYNVNVFSYPLADWRQNRAAILAKLPKQITAAAQHIFFY
ncbi:UDP-4-amino-4,6-dideoxy-N-acetyl-beta-L-altrosamine N-acetyltransferase [Rheinheimera fenheensis]|uniref:UDP-4-amino-4, 6-dideoxy-N-acetyl-beta-L-altrosamine N-acetyltransferase n=1 Tax=Rheinheimera fenheensis TaxID=3152295 RepID=UPI00325EB78B